MAGFATGVEKLRAQGVESNLCARRIQSLQLQRIDLRTCIPELACFFLSWIAECLHLRSGPLQYFRQFLHKGGLRRHLARLVAERSAELLVVCAKVDVESSPARYGTHCRKGKKRTAGARRSSRAMLTHLRRIRRSFSKARSLALCFSAHRPNKTSAYYLPDAYLKKKIRCQSLPRSQARRLS